MNEIVIREEKQALTEKAPPAAARWKPQNLLKCYRWLLVTDRHPEISAQTKRLQVDYLNKLIHLEVYDDVSGHALTWLQELAVHKHPLHLHHFNRSGDVVYIHTFSGLTVEKHEADYDYAKNEPLTHKVVVRFTTIDRRPVESRK